MGQENEKKVKEKSSQGDKEEEKENQKVGGMEGKTRKYKFECTKCGQCCQNRDPIPVTFTDIARWTKQGSFLTIILPHLELRSYSDKDEVAQIAVVPFIKMENGDENGKGKCPFYDSKNKICNIYFTMPIFCKTFPLSYSGQKFYVSDPSCPGIGKGSPTKEQLQEMRELAVRDFNERAETSLAMVAIQGLFIKHFMKQTQPIVDRLSDEEREQLDELIKKSREKPEESKETD